MGMDLCVAGSRLLDEYSQSITIKPQSTDKNFDHFIVEEVAEA